MSSQTPAPLETMLRLLNGHCVEQALHVVAVLGIADRLREGPRSSKDLALATGTDEQALNRVLRMLAAIDIFIEGQPGHFALTPLGTTLRSDVENSVRDRAIFYGASEMWKVWGNLLHSVKTGASALEDVHKEDFYGFLAKHPDIGAPFNRYMTKTSEQHIAALLKVYDFAQFRAVVDVGGGQGGTLAAILHACPELRGTLFDLPQVVEGTTALDAEGIAGRAMRVGGDMHETMPKGSDCYLIKWVLMDRSDEDAVKVLKNCRDAMADHAKVIVVEMVLPTARPSAFAAILDVQMLLLNGRGRLRNEQQYRDLFRYAGLKIVQLIPTGSPNTVIEAVQL